MPTINAQGQETTSNVRERENQSLKNSLPYIIVGITVSKIAPNTTIGVYIPANFVINCSMLAFLF